MFMAKQRRSSTRKARNHGAWITFDGDIRSYECRVVDVSAAGAKLVADIDADIGSSFRLSVAPHSIVRKPCEVVWRRGRQLGVKFTEMSGAAPLGGER
jgi:PilZ domain